MTEQYSPGEPTVQSTESAKKSLKALLLEWKKANRNPLIFAKKLAERGR